MLSDDVGTDGGLADYLVVEARNARKVPENVPLEVAGTPSPYTSSVLKGCID